MGEGGRGERGTEGEEKGKEALKCLTTEEEKKKKTDVPGHLHSQPEGSTAGCRLERQHISWVNLRDTMLYDEVMRLRNEACYWAW